MKPLKLVLLGMAANVLQGAAVAPAKLPFSHYLREYRQPAVEDSTFYNPFRVQMPPTTSAPTTAAMTNEEVAGILNKLGVQGVVLGPDGQTGHRVIIGDKLFQPGDEIAFEDDDGKLKPIEGGGTVKLTKISRSDLVFEISATGLASRLMTFSVAGYNRR